MKIVLDASAAGPLLIPDESAALLPGLHEALASTGAIIPSLWWIEIVNLLLTATRRGRLSEEDFETAVGTAKAVLLEVDGRTDEQLTGRTWTLARRHDLSIYDATYLELAIREQVPLATADGRLIAAAQRESVELFGR